jgi:hypothetical protein
MGVKQVLESRPGAVAFVSELCAEGPIVTCLTGIWFVDFILLARFTQNLVEQLVRRPSVGVVVVIGVEVIDALFALNFLWKIVFRNVGATSWSRCAAAPCALSELPFALRATAAS